MRVMAQAQETLVTRNHFDAKLDTLEARLDAKVDKLSWMMGILIAIQLQILRSRFSKTAILLKLQGRTGERG